MNEQARKKGKKKESKIVICYDRNYFRISLNEPF